MERVQCRATEMLEGPKHRINKVRLGDLDVTEGKMQSRESAGVRTYRLMG